jgi:2,3-bisphosphoglycerate-independent phosphoglycerate mutase
MQLSHRPYILIVLDGWGYSDNTQYNAIHSAHKPNWDTYWALYPHTLIRASGVDVGLPDSQMGNSEVGHMHLGAGRIIDQEFSRITRSIEDGRFFDNATLVGACARAASQGKAVHLMGLLSPGGVHSHEDHLLATLEIAARQGVKQLYVHAFLDGRDVPPKSAAASLQRVMMKCSELHCGRIASLIGRYFAMDRNQRWSRIQTAYELIVDGKGLFSSRDPLIALDEAYARGESDEFVKATVITPRNAEPARVEDGDLVIFVNFRADRARQLTEAFIDEDFSGFKRDRVPRLAAFVSFTEYNADFDIPVVFPTENPRNTFGEYVANLGLRQLRIAETEKYAHVTFFFNGGDERVFPGEDRILVPSPHVATYDLEPEMSANEVTDRLVEAIHSKKYDAIICNFANADMVGHTGNFEATIKAIETLDRCLGRIVGAAQAVGGELLITSDHGNAEKMRGIETKHTQAQAHTAHTSYPVPLIYIGRIGEAARTGTLADIAPTLLYLMGLPQPPEMTGHSLIKIDQAELADAEDPPRMRQRLRRYLR